MLDALASLGLVVLVILAGFIAVLTFVFLVEVLAAALSPRSAPIPLSERSARPRVGVLVPAHNESLNLLPTLADIKAQLAPGDRLLVVADNCSDDTAAVAKSAGAEIVERKDLTKIGKGYALDSGIRHLSADPPSIIIVVDADCRLSRGALDQLMQTTAATNRPSQALYLMTAPHGSSINFQVAEFAWRVKNWMRPLGLRALNLPCQLVGTGMAFPWQLIRSANLATGHLVEDLKLGLDLAAAGYPPVFCPSAVVQSTFPQTLKGAASQRDRWEHGHLHLAFERAPALICKALVARNLGLLVLALDVSIPPVTLLGSLNGLVLVFAGFAALVGIPPAALYLSLMSFTGFLVATLLAWRSHGRDVLPARSLPLFASYIFAKLGLYLRLLRRGPVSRWIRTDRQ
jgi:cellulose synthase/poly-beta-1,6-N-acetylglucosamine synthase-like glycosyltransferase